MKETKATRNVLDSMRDLLITHITKKKTGKETYDRLECCLAKKREVEYRVIIERMWKGNKNTEQLYYRTTF